MIGTNYDRGGLNSPVTPSRPITPSRALDIATKEPKRVALETATWEAVAQQWQHMFPKTPSRPVIPGRDLHITRKEPKRVALDIAAEDDAVKLSPNLTSGTPPRPTTPGRNLPAEEEPTDPPVSPSRDFQTKNIPTDSSGLMGPPAAAPDAIRVLADELNDYWKREGPTLLTLK